MKLLNYSFTKRHILGLLVGLLAGGTANAQYTGIGTTAPSAALHVKPIVNTVAVPSNEEPLRIEGMKDVTPAEVTGGLYSDVLLHDPASGLFRRESVEDLLDGKGEWIENGAGTAIIPRRYTTAMEVNNALVSIGATATSIGGTLGVTGATTLSSTLAVTGAATLSSTLGVTGATTLGNTLSVAGITTLTTVNDLATPVNATDQILFHGPGGVVQKADVADVLADLGKWIVDGSGNLVPREASYNGDFELTGTAMNVTVPTTITGNTAVTGTFGVTGNSTLTGTFGVTGTSSLGGEVTLGTVNDLATPVAGTDQILFFGPAGVVQKADVADVIADAGYWEFDGTTLNPRDAALADDFVLIDENLSIGATTAITGNTSVTGTFGVTGNSTLTGTLNVTGDSDFDANVNVDGNQVLDGTLSIGTVAEISGGPLAALDEILMQRAGTNLVEYVTVEDLVASNGEWSYQDNGTTGTYDAGDLIYLRRNGELDGGGNDVYATFEGNMVLDATKAYQFGDATNQINAIGITASAAYTMALGAGLAVNTAAGSDVVFTEAGAGVPWLAYDADAGGATEVGRVGINVAAPLATLHVAGNIVASNSTVSSDRRFKKDITDLSGALTAVKAMRGVSYDFRRNEFPAENFDDATHIGFIAQELQDVLPQAVFARADGFLTVDYAAVTPVLVEAVQELSKQVEALQAENATLRSASSKSIGAVSTKQLRELEARLADMDARLQEVAGRK